MDTRLASKPLAVETQSLARFLDTAKPSAVTKPETRLNNARTKRAIVAEAFQTACAEKFAEVQKGGLSWSESANGPSPVMRKLQAEIAACDVEIGHARADLLKARNEWRPRFYKQVQPQLAEALPQIERACELLEASADLFRLVDDFARDNALGANGYVATRLSDKIDDHVKWLRRFVKNRGQQ